MVRSTHHDMGFHGWDMANTAALDGAARPNEKPCHADPFGDAQGMLREASHCNAMLCNGEQRGFSEMVRSTHHDMGFRGWDMADAVAFPGLLTLWIR